MEKILVFGSGGMLGQYLCSLLEKENYSVMGNDRVSGGIDITREDEVNHLVTDISPDWVINCAAYTDVNKAEEERDIAFKVNASAPLYMAEACKKLNIPLIHISTDYIFGDNLENGYPEDYTNFKPLNIYGESKLEGEKNLSTTDSPIYIFRTSWLFGPGAKNFISKISQYANELPELKVVTDEIGCPTYVGDLSRSILSALKEEIKPGIYHVCSKDTCSRYDFAKEILELQDIKTPVLEGKLADFPRKAKVPNYSQLINTKLPEHRSWEEMLKEYFNAV